MPQTMELTDLDSLIDDLEERISDSELPTASGDSRGCSGVCTIVVCTIIVCQN